MKVFIMTDLEGPSGINGRSDGIGNTTVNTPTACQVLLDEVNACVRGLVKAGADEIVVWDGHGGSNSIDITKLEAPAKLGTIGGDLAPACQADASFDAAVLIGFHAMQGTIDGYMCHSFNSHAVCNMKLNGKPIGEIGMVSYECAYFGIPVILVSGDSAACREANELFAKVETVSTKDAMSRYTVTNNNPKLVQQEITLKSEKALKNLKKYKPLKIAAKLEYDVEFMCDNQASAYEKIGWQRISHNTVRRTGTDFIDVWAGYVGWAPGIHNKKYGITPKWRGEIPGGLLL